MINPTSRAVRSKHGFTLVEASISVTITTLVLGIAIGGYMFALKNTNESDTQSDLDIDVQLAMERLKKDLRLSSLDEIFYYPAGPGPYTAISFPLAEDSDGDGLFELDASGKIIWDKTLVYHIWPSSPNELRVTTFDNRINTLSDTQRQAQLDAVVTSGSGSGTYNGNNASTHMVFQNLLDWSISPKAGIFDAYSSITERETASLGYTLIANGPHTFQFKVAGKNAASRGYKIGIDQLYVSPSYGEREAEAQLPVTTQSGATAVAQYIANGSWKGNHQLYFPATAVGNSFTLTMDNDRWEESNFGAIGYEADNTVIKFDETLSPKDFVVQMEGNDVAWQAALQTGCEGGLSVSNTTLMDKTVYVHINGSELLTNGNWIAYNGRKCKLTFQASRKGNLQIKDVYIGKTTAQETTKFAWSTAEKAQFVVGGSLSDQSDILLPGMSATTTWVDMDINKTNNYLVKFKINNDPSRCFPMSWTNNMTANTECYVNGTPTNHIFALSSISVSYPANGTYTSQIFDTRLRSPVYGDVVWNADVPAGTVLTTKVHTGDLADLSDASDWTNITASASSHAISASYKRYVQFQAQFQSSSDGLSTPKLKDVTIDWTGDMQLVNITGVMTKGPDYGIVEVLVDGVPLQSALTVDLMIYKDIYNLNKNTKRVTSSLFSDIRPRNTGH